jgi:hypothetical protein
MGGVFHAAECVNIWLGEPGVPDAAYDVSELFRQGLRLKPRTLRDCYIRWKRHVRRQVRAMALAMYRTWPQLAPPDLGVFVSSKTFGSQTNH